MNHIYYAIKVECACMTIYYVHYIDGYSGGKATHAKTVAKQRYIGVTMLTLTPEIVVEIRSKVNLPLDVNSGVYINKVCVGSPAHKLVSVYV